MLFQSYKGKVFNSISFKHYKDRLGFSAEEYAVCIESDGELYIVLGDEDKRKAIEKAKHFANKHRVSVEIRYFKRVSADELINKSVCYISPSNKKHSGNQTSKAHESQSDKQEIDKEESKKELDVYLNNYLNSLNK